MKIFHLIKKKILTKKQQKGYITTKMKLTFSSFFIVLFLQTSAQMESIEQQGEIGFNVGAAHYFGDLNPRSAINKPGIAAGVFYLKQFNNYLGLRTSLHYAKVSYSDKYGKSDFQKRRNLNFNSNIVEISMNGEFNFLKFIPGDPRHSYTPYITLGLGVFFFNPYTFLNGNKVYLQPLGTEGQNISYIGLDGKKRKPYKTVSMCIPLGGGIKYNINNSINLSLQVAQRLTMTDYLDDVSTTYVGADKFNGQPTAQLLQDRSYEGGNTPIGVEGRQRGWSKQKDQYVIVELGISFNISKYRCPNNY